MNTSDPQVVSGSVAASKSLSDFFARQPAADLSNCDREEVHLLGTVQSEGALMVIQRETQKIIAASVNVFSILDIEPNYLANKSLREVHDELSENLDLLDLDDEGVHSVLDCEFSTCGNTYDAVVHGYLGNWIVEFIPAEYPPGALSIRKQLRLVTRESGRILNSDSIEDAMQIVCDAVRTITTFSRVQIFQFLPDWSGKIIVDSHAQHMSSFVGLHFPDTDIPLQARELMKLVPYRGVFSVHDVTADIQKNPEFGKDTIDLTYALTRSCSTMHTAYLRNMGVEATFSVSLMQDEKLWGFIACHHDRSCTLPFDNWTLLRELGTALMSRINHETARRTSEKVIELHKLEAELASTLRAKGDVMGVVGQFAPVLMQFMNADGFAFQFGDQLQLTGFTPPEEFFPGFVSWVQENTNASGQYSSASLHKEWPDAARYKKSACGVLLQPVASHRICQMIWFRRPLTESVMWAGEPRDKSQPVGQNDTATLSPRNSFEAWVSEHNEFSLPWTESEIAIAQEILREMLDIISSVLVLTEENTRLVLSEENTQLKSFAASAAAHDIKAPLRRIELALEIMEEDGFNPESIKQGHEIATKSAQVLKDVSAGILEFMSVPDKARSFTTVALSEIINNLDIVLFGKVERHEVAIETDTPHSVLGEKSLLTSLFLNLANNSIKYSKPEITAHIGIKSELVGDGWVDVSFSDNGIGIPAEYADRIFYPSERLMFKNEVEGSGMGLAICRRIVNIHSGEISVDKAYTDGARIVVRLPLGEDVSA
ncbi:MAG: ATP-binding protein [Granulosicoccus sp.]